MFGCISLINYIREMLEFWNFLNLIKFTMLIDVLVYQCSSLCWKIKDNLRTTEVKNIDFALKIENKSSEITNVSFSDDEEIKKEKNYNKNVQQQKSKQFKIQLDNDSFIQNNSKRTKSEERDEIIDINSAFVSNAASKIGYKDFIPSKNISSHSVINTTNNKDNINLFSSIIEDKEHPVTILASEGVQFAKNGKVNEAIIKFSAAILLISEDYRLYSNRCLCYLFIKEYNKALEDIQKCVGYAPDYSMGYVHMGEAYIGLNKFRLAEDAFDEVYKIEPICEEAINYILSIKINKLKEIGFSLETAIIAIRMKKTLTAALDYIYKSSNYFYSIPDLFYDNLQECNNAKEHYIQNSSIKNNFDDSSSTEMATSTDISLSENDKLIHNECNSDPFTDFTNPYHCNNLYIGNVASKVTQNNLEKIFSRFGKINYINMIRDRKCAFIIYEDWKSAGKAMEKLQDWSILDGTPPLSIRYTIHNHKRFTESTSSRFLEEPNFNKDSNSRKSYGINDSLCSMTMPSRSPTQSLSSIDSCFSYTHTGSHMNQQKMNFKLCTSSNYISPCESLFVGNLFNVKERDLHLVFSKYGKIVNITVIPEKNFGFVNFTDVHSANMAMKNLQEKKIFPGCPPLYINYSKKTPYKINSRNPIGIMRRIKM